MKSKRLFFKINLENKVILAGYVSKEEVSYIIQKTQEYMYSPH
jgi:hypothetical protein